ncbi:hypothetical protein MVEG_12059 [Podila verticillata NRRL 6337]|uniref:Uncharacterized protein n=1 Tax=Podila verticillata NRRL 6337 TaxID=1069443 RepID=A0A086TL40_9FUNG|nr:hypothetical protein MVEG_12059 [Podila verticillata NRRL 6337]
MIDLISSDSETEQEDTSMLTPAEEPISNGHAVRNNTSSSRTTARHDSNTASSNSTTTPQEGVIDLTSDVEDDVDEIEYTQPREVTFWDTPTRTPTPDHQRSRGKSVRLSLELVETGKSEQIHPPCPPGLGKGKQRADTSRRVDDDRHPSPSVGLRGKQHTSPSVDQGRQTRPGKDQNEKQHEEQKEDDLPKQPQRPPESQSQPPPPSPRTAPAVQLWVDTQLLGPWMYEPRALFEFSGQVVFDRTLGDDSGLSVGSRARNESGIRREGPGRWVMLAKSARNMEGLDLHAYRHSIDQWLAKHFHAQNQEPPAFERTQETAQFLRELMELNQTQDKAALETLNALEECSLLYQDEDTKLKEVIQAFGITKDQLRPDTQLSLEHLAELGMLLNLSDLTLPSFQQAFSLLRLDTLQPYTTQAHETQARLDSHLAWAEHELQELVQLRNTLAKERDTVHDMEIRNKRRSLELMKREYQQQAQEEQSREQGEGGDVEAQGLTVAQIKAQEAVVIGLQDQVDVQTKNLAAYQEIPPDYTLAMLKLNEAEARLNQLSVEHESLVQRLADDL